MKFCNECKTRSRKITFIGKDGNNKIFTSICKKCGYDYMFVINKKLNKVWKTENLKI